MISPKGSVAIISVFSEENRSQLYGIRIHNRLGSLSAWFHVVDGSNIDLPKNYNC